MLLFVFTIIMSSSSSSGSSAGGGGGGGSSSSSSSSCCCCFQCITLSAIQSSLPCSNLFSVYYTQCNPIQFALQQTVSPNLRVCIPRCTTKGLEMCCSVEVDLLLVNASCGR